MTTTHATWAGPHTIDDILTVARSPDAAAPTEIHVGPVVHARMLDEAVVAAAPVVVDEHRAISRLDGIPVVLDEELPAFPGYEIHRCCSPPARVGGRPPTRP